MAGLVDLITSAMKSHRDNDASRKKDGFVMSTQFWNWFVSVQEAIEGVLDKSPDAIDPSVITERVKKIHPQLGWELGPGTLKACRLVISPSGVRSLIPIADAAIRAAPELEAWEFLSCKPPKNWGYEMVLRNNTGQSVRIEAKNWKYALTGFAGTDAFDIVFVAPNLPDMDAPSRVGAAFIALDSIFGERVATEVFMKLALVSENEASQALGNRLTRIQLLKDHISSLMAEREGNA